MKLFEFLYQLIEIQIEKYSKLAKLGIGPDARLNAALVLQEVDELLLFGKELLTSMQNDLPDSCLDNKRFNTLFHQIKFYLEQEYRRGYSGWLLDDNQTHNTVFERTTEQLELLGQIGALINIDCSSPSLPVTEIQKQCQYDSAAIALYILDLAKQLKENPDMALPDPKLQHAAPLLRRNARSRYQDPKIAEEITKLHDICSEIMASGSYHLSSQGLSKEESEKSAFKHREQLHRLLTDYSRFAPDFATAQENKKEQQLHLHSPKPSIFANKNLLFGGIIGIILVCMLLSYFRELHDGKGYPPSLELYS